MVENNSSNRTLYAQAILNSSSVTEETFKQLIGSYPYSQPLYWAYERRKWLNGESSPHRALAVLTAPSPSWLYSYVNAGVQHVDAVVNEDLALEPVIERDEFEEQLSNGTASVDYFVFEEKTQVPDVDGELVEQKGSDSDDVSLYYDDLMPYSFRWWLHKTRLEHAHSYQPFATVKLPAPAKGEFDFRKLDEAVLDQQIKESIIHFQDPEAKLSDQVKSRPAAEGVVPKKTDKIIEQFIREEPIIQPPKAESLNSENMARRSAEDNYVFVTETLAQVYLDQGLFLKAIEVFKKLILKYPEKKSYFGDQIEKIEKNL